MNKKLTLLFLIISLGTTAQKIAVSPYGEKISLVPSAVGLGSVDNTSDANKPISTAQQTALNGKVNDTGDTMTGPLFINSTNQINLTVRNTTATANSQSVFALGNAASSKNQAELLFNYAASASNNNFLGFGFNGVPSIFRIYADTHSEFGGRVDLKAGSNITANADGAFSISSNQNTAYSYPVELMASALTNGNGVGLHIGKSGTAFNTGKLRYKQGADNNSNLLTLGFHSADDIFGVRSDNTIQAYKPLNMNSNSITNLANGTISTDAVNKSQLDLVNYTPKATHSTAWIDNKGAINISEAQAPSGMSYRNITTSSFVFGFTGYMTTGITGLPANSKMTGDIVFYESPNGDSVKSCVITLTDINLGDVYRCICNDNVWTNWVKLPPTHNYSNTHNTYKLIGYTDTGKEIRRYYFNGTLPAAGATPVVLVNSVESVSSNGLMFNRGDATVQWHSISNVQSGDVHASLLFIDSGKLSLFVPNSIQSLTSSPASRPYKGYVEIIMQ